MSAFSSLECLELWGDGKHTSLGWPAHFLAVWQGRGGSWYLLITRTTSEHLHLFWAHPGWEFSAAPNSRWFWLFSSFPLLAWTTEGRNKMTWTVKFLFLVSCVKVNFLASGGWNWKLKMKCFSVSVLRWHWRGNAFQYKLCTNLSVLRGCLGLIGSCVHACRGCSNRRGGGFFHHIGRHLFLSEISHKTTANYDPLV